MNKSASEAAYDLGSHIFRWGSSCSNLGATDFTTEKKKACGQVESALKQFARQEIQKCLDRVTSVCVCTCEEISSFKCNYCCYEQILESRMKELE